MNTTIEQQRVYAGQCEYNNQDKLEYIQRQSKEVVQALRLASQSRLVQALADRIELCSSSRNLYTATDLHSSETGEVFDGKGSFWACNSRLCAGCCGNLSKRNRKKVKAIFQKEKLLVGENWYFITLTMPDLCLKGLDLFTIRSVIYEAHRKFYRSTFWQKLSRGSVKSEEFTVGNFDQTHYHIHLLAICRTKIQHNDFVDIRKAWTEALEFSFRKFGIVLEVNTKDGYADVNVKKVRDSERAVFEICKYLTKNDSWLKLDRKALVQIAEIERFPRMFEMFGVCKGGDESQQNDKPDSKETYFNKNNLTVKNASQEEPKKITWRTACQLLSREKWLEFLNKQFVICCGYRKEQLKLIFPCASFQTLSGLTF